MSRRLVRGFLGAALIGLLAGCGGGGGTGSGQDVIGPGCATSADCRAAPATDGLLCIEGACVGCQGDHECTQAPAYGAGSTCRDGKCATADCPAGSDCAGADADDTSVAEKADEPSSADSLDAHLPDVVPDLPDNGPEVDAATPDQGTDLSQDMSDVDVFVPTACPGCPCGADGACDEPDTSCQAGACEPCDAGDEGCGCFGQGKPDDCAELDLVCDEDTGRCQKCFAGSEDCACNQSGHCDEGLWCDPDAERCAACEAGKPDCPCLGNACQAGYACHPASQTCVPLVCVDGELDCPCLPDQGCQEGLRCNASNLCVDCTPDQVGCPCVGSACQGGLVCDTADATCRLPLGCGAGGVVCAAHQPCQPATVGVDALCLPQCDAGYAWKAVEKRCDLIACGSADPVTATCASQHRECVATGGGAVCADCLANFGPDAGGAAAPCVPCPWRTQGCPCDQGACNGGLECDDATDTCAVACMPGSAGCGCRATGDACDQGLSCVNDACVCPAGAEGCACLPGGGCADDLHCDGITSTCQACVWNPATMACVDCGTLACTSAGDKPLAAGGGFYPLVTSEGRCLCVTEPGYYYDYEEGRTAPCDLDEDGWVRDSAPVALKRAQDFDDEAVLANYHCDVVLRTVDRVVLHADDAQSTTVELGQLLPPITAYALYEPKRNDDQDLIDTAIANEALSPLSPGRNPRARELNALTKACVHPTSDYNQNGKPDMTEWDLDPTVDADKAVASRFSYFIELHRGWYEPPTDGLGYGAYHVAEKHRVATVEPSMNVALAYDAAETGTYWRECQRLPLLPVQGQAAVGKDFARYSKEADFWPGMTHVSQFQCRLLQVDDVQDTTPADGKADVLGDWSLNHCTFSPGWSGPLGGVENPDDPVLSCQPQTSPTTFEVVWAAARYKDYGGTPGGEAPGPYAAPGPYVRGCVTECVDRQMEVCPRLAEEGYNEYVYCRTEKLDFGRAVCGCNCGDASQGGFCTDVETSCVVGRFCDQVDANGNCIPCSQTDANGVCIPIADWPSWDHSVFVH